MATGETVDRLNAASVNAAPQDFAKPARRTEARASARTDGGRAREIRMAPQPSSSRMFIAA